MEMYSRMKDCTLQFSEVLHYSTVHMNVSKVLHTIEVTWFLTTYIVS